MIANRMLITSLFFYLLAIIFHYYQWPGTLELSIFSIPTVSLLLFRHYRIHLKMERNMFIRLFSILMSIFISISLMIPLISLNGKLNIRMDHLLLMSWFMLILMNLVYYSYYAVKTKMSEYKFGYLLILLACVLYIIEGTIIYSLDSGFITLKFATFIALLVMSIFLIVQMARKIEMPKIELGFSLLIGAVFINSINIFFLYQSP